MAALETDKAMVLVSRREFFFLKLWKKCFSESHETPCFTCFVCFCLFSYKGDKGGVRACASSSL